MAHIVVSLLKFHSCPERHILEGVVVLKEKIHELHSKKLHRVIFIVDFEKAYDKDKCSIFQQALRMKGFDTASRQLVHKFIRGWHWGESKWLHSSLLSSLGGVVNRGSYISNSFQHCCRR